MDTAVKYKSFLQPKTMAELLPELCSISSKDAGQSLTAKKQPRSTIVVTRTSEKVFKPMTIAELKALAPKMHSPKRNPQPNTATKKLNWNSSVKMQKTMSHTAERQLRQNSVRKVLNFVPKTKLPASNLRATLMSSETPKFPKPKLRAKKSLQLLDKSSVRISGICNIPPTPVAQNKITKPLITKHQKNKENRPYQTNLNRTKITAPKDVIQKKLKQPFPDTPLSNLSFKSNGDASFLLKEQEINDIEERTRALSFKENIAKVSPASTPFKEYRSVEEFFNNTGDTEISYNDTTIMSLDKVTLSKVSVIREQSVIVSLCELLNKATVTATDTTNTELNVLLEVENNMQHNIEMLMKIIESQLITLQTVRKLINEKKNLKSVGDGNAILNHVEIVTPAKKESILEKSSILRPSVIKIKSPSYKIPRKIMCLRKKVIRKSMLNESHQEMKTPVKSTDKAWNMYMQIKEKMNFLNTPSVKRNLEPPDTPSLTSHNLQKQLDKLYNVN